jgi:hypothetical protein
MASIVLERSVDRNDELAVRSGQVRFLRVPSHRFVMADGTGPPATETFAARIPPLYSAAYGLRFALKRRGIETRVGPLEGLWWQAGGMTDLDAIFGPDTGGRDGWRWTLMIAVPDAASDEEVETHLAAARERAGEEVAASLRVEPFDEGDVAQILHVGPYAAERASIERLHAAVEEAGLRLRGRHHELYLGDPRTSAPERLRTLLRHPVELRAG